MICFPLNFNHCIHSLSLPIVYHMSPRFNHPQQYESSALIDEHKINLYEKVRTYQTKDNTLFRRTINACTKTCHIYDDHDFDDCRMFKYQRSKRTIKW